METKEICDGMLHDAHSILDKAEKLAAENERLRKREQELLDQIAKAGGFNVEVPEWIEFDENVEEQRPFDGELVVVQVADCNPTCSSTSKAAKSKSTNGSACRNGNERRHYDSVRSPYE